MNLADVTKRIHAHEVRLENHQTRIGHLEQWEQAQNGRLNKIDEKLDKFVWYFLTLFAGILANLLVVLAKS